MEKQIITTKDGSSSVLIPEMNVTYHSIYGAMQESKHVFICAGLMPFIESKTFDTITIFEMGFGTGLNALLSLEQAIIHQQKIHYIAIELFPLNEKEIECLSYNEHSFFKELHQCNWEQDIVLNEYFILHKTKQSIFQYKNFQPINLIYYDAFAPSAQPELWTKSIFENVHACLQENGVLVTYCSKGDVRRAMLAAGFKVEKLQGPPHKREMLRAKKISIAE